MRKVRIVNVRKGAGAREKFTYATLVDCETGENLINATLPYICAACADPVYNYELTNALAILQELFPYRLDTTPDFR